MDAALWSTLAVPGKITNIWGKSGAGKTSLALDMSLSEIRDENGKVLYITDDVESVAALLAVLFPQEGARSGLATRVADGFILIQSPTFKSLGQIIQQIQFAFLPDDVVRESAEFKSFVAAGENDINEKVIESLKAYKPPSMVIIDEVTRQFRRQSIEAEDAGPLILQLVMQLGFLKNLAVEKRIKVVLTSANRTITTSVGSTDETRFIDVPVANDVLDHYVDIDVQMQWTPHAGKRYIIITCPNENNKQLQHVITMETLHDRLAGGFKP
ncbi:MAG: AAA family ATPase [Candidatus Sigynarchaeota archaeon]